MSILELLRPVPLQAKIDLQLQLEEEKRKLEESTRRAARSVQETLLDAHFAQKRPIETAIALMLGGYCLARWVQERRPAPVAPAHEASEGEFDPPITPI